jgi:hypothetical protein
MTEEQKNSKTFKILYWSLFLVAIFSFGKVMIEITLEQPWVGFGIMVFLAIAFSIAFLLNKNSDTF